MSPAGLDHRDLGVVVEIRQRAHQEVGRGDEIRVEDRDELPRRLLQTGIERARLVTGPIHAVEVVDIEAARGMAADGKLRDLFCLVGRIVQNLDLEQVLRVIELADGRDQPVGHVHFVEDRKLDGDPRQNRGRRQSGAGTLSLFFM